MNQLSLLYFKGKISRFQYFIGVIGSLVFYGLILYWADKLNISFIDNIELIMGIILVYINLVLHVARVKDLPYKTIFKVLVFLGVFIPMVNLLSFAVLLFISGFKKSSGNIREFRCVKCGALSKETDFQCKKCGEEFWASKEKHEEFLRQQ